MFLTIQYKDKFEVKVKENTASLQGIYYNLWVSSDAPAVKLPYVNISEVNFNRTG